MLADEGRLCLLDVYGRCGVDPTHSLVKMLHFGAVFPIAVFDVLLAAVDGKVVEVVGFDTKHDLKGVGCDPAKLWAGVVDRTGASFGIVVDAPALIAH